MPYSREELITIGARFEPARLLDWSNQVAQAARRDLKHLSRRGISEATIQAIETSQKEVRKHNLNGDSRALKELDAVAGEAFEQAFNWRQEVLGLAKAVFDSRPEVLAQFRPGVRVSRSIPKLIEEISILLSALRERADALRGVGGSEELVQRGESAIAALRQAESQLSADLAGHSAATVALAEQLGTLYTRARFVGRIARTHFRKNPEHVKPYSYDNLRSQQEAKRRTGAPVAIR